MKLLLINPNITPAITEVMAAEARASANAGTEITAVTAEFGTLYIENRAEAAIASHAVLDVYARHHHGADAVIVSAFGDPGAIALKELASVPVVGLAEAALLTAWSLGRRITIVCMTERLRRWYEECVHEHGLAARVVAVRALDEPPTDATTASETLAEPMRDLCQLAVEEDRAEVIMLGGGPMAGIARRIANQVDVPLVDGVQAAVGYAEMLARMCPTPARRGSFATPRAKPSKGLSSELAAQFVSAD